MEEITNIAYGTYTFTVNNLDFSEIMAYPQPDGNIENIINQLKKASIWVDGVPYALKYGDTFTVSGELAQRIKNQYLNKLPKILEVAIPTVTTDSIDDVTGVTTATGGGEVTSEGGAPVTSRGICYGLTENPRLDDEEVDIVTFGSGAGTFSGTFDVELNETYYARAYATNVGGTAYGDQVSFETILCLAKGTKIRLADNTLKNIEDITHDDNLLVWNFDEGRFDSAYPLWIKKSQIASRYNLLKFSNGAELKTIEQHRIFSKEQGSFVYPMVETTPLGTTSFDENEQETTLISREIVNEKVEYFNIITNRHINLFANSILTSCRYNNIYPIEDMKFVKDDRELITQDRIDVPEEYFNGLRLEEQNIPIEHTECYVNRLLKNAEIHACNSGK